MRHSPYVLSVRLNRLLVIDIRAEPAGDYVQLSVADNGIGIEPRFADKIFQMFYRLHDEDEYETADHDCYLAISASFGVRPAEPGWKQFGLGRF